MHIEYVPNRKSKPCILVRESYRDGKKVCKRTLANITNWPSHRIQQLDALFKGGRVVSDGDPGDLEVVRTLPHGHVAAVLGTLRQLGMDRLISSTPSRERDLAVAMVVARIINPGSKLDMARGFADESALSTLAAELGIADADEDDLYAAMDWLLPRQSRIEDKLAARHLRDGILMLYDVSSSYFEGHCCPLAQKGHSRDDKDDKLQIVYGLLCDPDGRPVAIEVFEGNTGDPSTLASQIGKIRERFGLQHVVLVGDRGMITDARLEEDIKPVAGLTWLTALRAPAIKKLASQGLVQPGLFDSQNMAEISSPDFPGERLIVCRNPYLGEERRRKRQDLLAATEKELAKILTATTRTRHPLRGEAEIALRVGKVINQYKMAKHFKLEITATAFSYQRDPDNIAGEEALDGIYIVRTPVPAHLLSTAKAVGAYKSLAHVERAFRSLKTVDLKIRPIHHRLADRVRAHVFLCMLAYYVEWHMRQALAPLLFDDTNPEPPEDRRPSVVAPAKRSPEALEKAMTKETPDGDPVHSFQALLRNLGTIARNQLRVNLPGAPCFEKTTIPTPFQQKALDLLQVKLR